MPGRLATREYVWGTGYADEILCQLDRGAGVDPQFADLYYYLQDANYNVAAVLDDSANVLLQYTYDPYGNLAAIDVDPDGVLGIGDPPHNAIAHQGLFFERFFGSAADLLADRTLAPADTLTGTGPAGLYHNRNRWYSPDLGRFITRDPNESALPIVVALTRNGESWSILLGAFDATAHYADGMNLYLYLGGNPINGLDALGLDWNDAFDEVLQVVGSIFGERAAAGAAVMAQVGVFFNSAMLIGQMAVSFMPGYDAVMLGVMLAQGQSVGWMDLLGAGLDLSGPIGKALGVFGATVFAYAHMGSGLKFANYGDEFVSGVGKAVNRFADDHKLLSHWSKHAGEWTPPLSKEVYNSMANAFLHGSPGPGVLQKVRVNGDIVRYNPITNEFGVVSTNGTVRTFFRPDPAKHGYPTNMDYFNAQ